MRKVTIALSALLSTSAIAQDCENGLDTLLFERSLNAQFSKVIDPSSTTNIGNYAGLDIKDGSASLGASSMGPKGNVVAIKFTGAVEDGVAAIWQNRKLNTGITADVQYHFLSGRKQALSILTDSCIAANARFEALRDEIELRNAELNIRRDTLQLAFDVRKLRAALSKAIADSTRGRSVLDSLGKIEPAARSARWAGLRDTTKFLYDSLTVELPGSRLRLIDKEAAFKRRLALKEKDLQDECDILFAKRYNALLTPLAVNGIDLCWVSVGLGYTSSKFKLYNDTLPHDDQVVKRVYGSWEARLQVSKYHRAFVGNDHNYFVSLGISGGQTDNHGGLDEFTLEDRTQQGPDSASRTEIANYKVLKGEYQYDLWTASLFLDAYYFVGKNSTSAVHLFPSYTVTDLSTPSFNLGAGFLLGYVKKDDTKNAVNVELFLEFNDLFNGASEDNDAWKRSDLGLRVSFPFNFPQKP